MFLPLDRHGPPRFVRSFPLRLQNAIFQPSKNHLVFCFPFFSKKLRKSLILAPQNPSKIHPKCLQNRCLKKHAIFQRFLLIFGCLLQEPNLKFHAPTQCFVSFSQKSSVRFWHTFSVQKTFQKPFQNEVRTLPKSMPKRCCLSTSIFSGFGLDLGGSWASKSAALL